MSVRFFDELTRVNHVTPTSYLELLMMYKIIMKEKTTELKNAMNRLQTGLDRLISANE
jgi:dynein heavy chain